MNNQIFTIQQKIKDYTKEKPSDRGIADPAYKVYLANCSRLLELDVQLNSLQNMEYADTVMVELLESIEKEVNAITGIGKKDIIKEDGGR